uniref:Uncharacterized protein n=1 Tax=Anopheles atroparvus TaxID=41427 RepID=A0AAG5DPU2_ANOAO
MRSTNRHAPYTIPIPSRTPPIATRTASRRTVPTTNTEDELMDIALQKIIKMCDTVEKTHGPDESYLNMLREILTTKLPEDKLQFKVQTIQMANALRNAVGQHASPSNVAEIGNYSGTGQEVNDYFEEYLDSDSD